MPSLSIDVEIDAPIERCFDLIRSVDVHLDTGRVIQATVIDGRKTGLSELGDSTTWTANFFGARFKMTTVIKSMDYPKYCSDEMVKSLFNSFTHSYTLKEKDGKTVVKDEISFRSPLYPFGYIIDKFVLGPKIYNVQKHRISEIKRLAEDSNFLI